MPLAATRAWLHGNRRARPSLNRSLFPALKPQLPWKGIPIMALRRCSLCERLLPSAPAQADAANAPEICDLCLNLPADERQQLRSLAMQRMLREG